jgi:uncharacterized membrane protein YjjB (DUF3815 family)
MIGELTVYLWQSLPLLIAALLGTLGFALVFKMKGSYLFFVSAGGFCTYGIYLIVTFFGCSEFIAALVSSMFVALLSEILARGLKAPTVIFLTTISISIVPGSGLYYSMRYLLLQNLASFAEAFKSTCSIAAGIVCGIVIISVVMKIFMTIKNRISPYYQ